MVGLAQAKKLIRKLSLAQLRRLEEWLHELIRKVEANARANLRLSGGQIVEERTLKNVTYRLEGVRCGKENCKCSTGKSHGPYWYSYTRVGDKVKSQYIGKTLPRELERAKRK
jgi:hypothetical protein